MPDVWFRFPRTMKRAAVNQDDRYHVVHARISWMGARRRIRGSCGSSAGPLPAEGLERRKGQTEVEQLLLSICMPPVIRSFFILFSSQQCQRLISGHIFLGCSYLLSRPFFPFPNNHIHESIQLLVPKLLVVCPYSKQLKGEDFRYSHVMYFERLT